MTDSLKSTRLPESVLKPVIHCRSTTMSKHSELIKRMGNENSVAHKSGVDNDRATTQSHYNSHDSERLSVSPVSVLSSASSTVSALSPCSSDTRDSSTLYNGSTSSNTVDIQTDSLSLSSQFQSGTPPFTPPGGQVSSSAVDGNVADRFPQTQTVWPLALQDLPLEAISSMLLPPNGVQNGVLSSDAQTNSLTFLPASSRFQLGTTTLNHHSTSLVGQLSSSVVCNNVADGFPQTQTMKQLPSAAQNLPLETISSQSMLLPLNSVQNGVLNSSLADFSSNSSSPSATNSIVITTVDTETSHVDDSTSTSEACSTHNSTFSRSCNPSCSAFSSEGTIPFLAVSTDSNPSTTSEVLFQNSRPSNFIPQSSVNNCDPLYFDSSSTTTSYYPASSDGLDNSVRLQSQILGICDAPVNSSGFLVQEFVSKTVPPSAGSSFNSVASIQSKMSINVMDSTLLPQAGISLNLSAKGDQVALQGNLSHSIDSLAQVDIPNGDYFSGVLQPSSSNICSSEVQDILQQFS